MVAVRISINYAKKLNINSQFVDGLRVTSSEILAVTQMALLGKTNAILAKQFNHAEFWH